MKRITLGLGCIFLGSLQGFSAPSNPASVAYVNQAVQNAMSQLTAGDGILINGTTISTTPFVSIGDLYQGGIVYYVDATGRHGLTVSLSDQSTLTSMSESETLVYATATGVGAGEINTANILATLQAAGDFSATQNAAYYANNVAVMSDGTTSCLTPSSNFTNTCFGGWYLGSVYELQLLSLNFDAINTAITSNGGTAISSTNNYWSSVYNPSGSLNQRVYRVILGTGETTATVASNEYSVRAIRKF